MMPHPDEQTLDRYLIIDDTDEHITQILFVACESFSSRGSRPADIDGGQA